MPRPSGIRPRGLVAALTVTALLAGAAAAAAQPQQPRPVAAESRPVTAAFAAEATGHRILFDNAHAETAGNADWIISTSQPDPLAQDPAPSAESDWTGALSAWGVALQKTGGYSLKTLPSGSSLGYGTTAALDLGNFDTLVVPEPNTLFTAAEKTAIMKFVQAGGGLFMIADHTGADRNNDGYDAVEVFNDLMNNNTVDPTNPFGITVDTLNIGSDFPSAVDDAADPVLHGTFGDVRKSLIASGTTATLRPADNPAVKGLLYRTGHSGTTGAFFATSTFGSGRVAFWGDTSPVDDGTGQSGNTLYDGWNDPGATNAPLALNATAWLSGGEDGGATTPPPSSTCAAAQLLRNNGFESGAVNWSASGGVITNSTARTPRTGSYYAWLGGHGTAVTETLSQPVTVPAGCSATLGFHLKIDTAETGTTAYDTLKVQVLDSSGAVLGTLATYSNRDALSSYTRRTFDLSAYAGRTVTLRYTATEGSKLQTSFVIDDTALDVA
jgi:hypothetical protein